MTGLLSLIESLSFNQVIIKAVTRYGNNWIDSLWRSPEIMKKEYAAKNYIISMKEVKKNTSENTVWNMSGTYSLSNKYNECWFIITNTQ